jgi:hypothetical protein
MGQVKLDTSPVASEIRRKIEDRTALVGVIGLGYVGLPLALTFAEQTYRVLGFDVDRAKIDALAQGRMYIQHLDPDRVARAASGGRLGATDDFARLGEPDVILICVPTPLTPQREPDMSYVVGTARQIRAHLRRGQLVILESTTYPGTTDELVGESSRARACAAAIWPRLLSRARPGNAKAGTATIPRSWRWRDGGDLAQAFYDKAWDGARRQRARPSDEARREHLPCGEHRARQRAQDRLRQDGDRRVGCSTPPRSPSASCASTPAGLRSLHPARSAYLAWKAREYGGVAGSSSWPASTRACRTTSSRSSSTA